MHLATLANIILVVAVVSAALWFFRRARRVSSTVRGEIAVEKKGRSWSGFVAGIAFTVYGLAAAVTGKADMEPVQVQGTNVRIAGALLSVVGVLLAASAFKRR